MRKLFRFKYEPCNGTCYAWCDHLPQELENIPEENARIRLITTMVDAHNKLCDNPNYSFGVDMDDNERFFVAHFRTPEFTHMYSGRDFSEVVNRVCQEVLNTNIPQIEGACNFGNNGAEDLGKEILRALTDIEYRKQHHNNCPCKKAAA